MTELWLAMYECWEQTYYSTIFSTAEKALDDLSARILFLKRPSSLKVLENKEGFVMIDGIKRIKVHKLELGLNFEDNYCEQITNNKNYTILYSKEESKFNILFW